MHAAEVQELIANYSREYSRVYHGATSLDPKTVAADGKRGLRQRLEREKYMMLCDSHYAKDGAFSDIPHGEYRSEAYRAVEKDMNRLVWISKYKAEAAETVSR